MAKVNLVRVDPVIHHHPESGVTVTAENLAKDTVVHHLHHLTAGAVMEKESLARVDTVVHHLAAPAIAVMVKVNLVRVDPVIHHHPESGVTVTAENLEKVPKVEVLVNREKDTVVHHLHHLAAGVVMAKVNLVRVDTVIHHPAVPVIAVTEKANLVKADLVIHHHLAALV